MLKRLLVAAIFLPLFVWLIYLPVRWPFFILINLILILALVELALLIRRRGLKTDWIGPAVVTTAAGLAAGFYGGSNAGLHLEAAAVVWLLLMGALLVFALREVLAGFRESAVPAFSAAILPLLVIAGVGSFVYLLYRLPQGPQWITLLFGFNWIYDAGAMFGGMLFGRRKLAPTISPAKTVEGLATGLLLNVLAAVAAYQWWVPRDLGFSLAGFVALGVLLGLLSQAGDLVESLVKRWAGAKDASQLIPGHGGVLDKIDNLLFTAPVLFVIAWLLQVL